MKIFQRATVVLACGLLGACQNLNYDDPNRPSVSESLGSIANMETTVGTATKYLFGGVIMGNSITFRAATAEATFDPAIDGLDDEMTFAARSTAYPVTSVMDEPRTEVDHHSNDWTVNKSPYNDAYTAIADCHDVRTQIAGGFNGQVFPNFTKSDFVCKMVMGVGHLYLGTMFDKAIIVPDDDKPIDLNNKTFVAHDSVVEFAKTLIHQGILEAMDTTSSTNTTATGNPTLVWFNGAAYSNVDLAKIMYGYLARAEVWKAATPAQRQDKSNGGVVDWAKVITYVDSSLNATWFVNYLTLPGAVFPNAPTASPQMPTTLQNTGGMVGANFTIRGSTTFPSTRSADLFNLMSTATDNYFRVSDKFLGPGDTTGAYANYLRTPMGSRHDTTYASPDKRLPKGPVTAATVSPLPRHVSVNIPSKFTTDSAIAGADGNYFQLLAGTGTGALPMTAFGLPAPDYNKSSYQFIRFGGNAASPITPRRTDNSSVSISYTDWQTIMTPLELQLLKAEAYIRLGNPAAAVAIINVSRQDPVKGGLPPVGVNGPQEPYPQCVPHSYTNAEACGNLMDAMLYEKRMESIGTDMFVNWADWRAFGYLDPGSIVYFPPSYRETQAMGYPYYTYGGTLPGSANSPTKCGTGTWQSIGCVDYTSVTRLPTPP